MNLSTIKWVAILLISAAAVEATIYHNVPLPVRPIVILWFLLICPGMAFVQLLQIKDALHEMVLAVALSLAIDVIVAMVILYAGLWSPALILSILIILCSLGMLCQLFFWHRLRFKRNVEHS
jgi:hypothetical protein